MLVLRGQGPSRSFCCKPELVEGKPQTCTGATESKKASPLQRLVVQTRHPMGSPHLDYKPLSNSDDIQARCMQLARTWLAAQSACFAGSLVIRSSFWRSGTIAHGCNMDPAHAFGALDMDSL